MKFLRNGKEITKEEVRQQYGEQELNRRIAEAIEAYREDPLELISWADGFEIAVEVRA